MTPRGFIAFLVMVLTFAGCGVATMTESGVLPAPAAPAERVGAALAPPQPLFPGGLRTVRPSGTPIAEPAPVADGETAVEPTAAGRLATPSQLAGPSGPPPAGPAWPVVQTPPAAVAPGPV